MQKLFIKKSWKNEQKSVQDIENNGYLDAHQKKKEMNKIALAL
jgi:hypothetical protein